MELTYCIEATTYRFEFLLEPLDLGGGSESRTEFLPGDIIGGSITIDYPYNEHDAVDLDEVKANMMYDQIRDYHAWKHYGEQYGFNSWESRIKANQDLCRMIIE
jgi:hypothetical protein